MPAAPVFADVPSGQRFSKEITWMAQQGIAQGWTQGGRQYFGPALPLSRQDFAAFLIRFRTRILADDGPGHDVPPAVSPFVDVPTSHGLYREIAWMDTKRITRVVGEAGNRYFGPTNPTKRFEVAAFLYRSNWVGPTVVGTVDEDPDCDLPVGPGPPDPAVTQRRALP
jgi:hypothetical protein